MGPGEGLAHEGLPLETMGSCEPTGWQVVSRKMYSKRLKSDLVGLCKQRGLHIGRLTKEQLIAQLEEGDHSEESVSVSEISRLADARQQAPCLSHLGRVRRLLRAL